MPVSRCLPLLACLAASASAASVWIEGESPSRSTVQKHGWYDAVKRELLSGGDWLSHYGDEPGEAEYRFTVPEAGKYRLWARLNPVASKVQWSAAGREWSEVDFKGAMQQQNIAGDGRVDHRFIAWVRVAELELPAGPATLTFRFAGPTANSGGLDCLLLESGTFTPQGTMRPEASAPAGPADWFPLLAGDDPFDPRSITDMSRLVPAPAGELGFLRADGDVLRFEKSPVPRKFWGTGANVEPGRYTREQLTQRARYLRKHGINSVRQHAIFDELTTRGVLDPEKLDQYDWWFAELKRHGIYSAWSVFYHFTIGPDDGYPPELYGELPAVQGGRRDTYGLMTVSPELQRIRNRWLVSILQHRNPYTGLRYVDDPALITVEMQNEDSVFFWNPLGELAKPDGRWPEHARLLRRRFAEWVRARYPDDADLKAAWGDLRHGDSTQSDELAIMGPWELDSRGPRGPFAGQTRRAGDFIRCLAEMQRTLFEECKAAIRGAGFRGVVITTAWQSGSPASDAANLWTDTAGDMIDRHNYFGGGAGGHGIAEGKVNNGSHLSAPGSGLFSIAMRQVENMPFSVTEWTQLPPNQWKAEAAPIMAFYGLGLQGWDASWHFAQSGTRIGDGWPGMRSYATDTPHYIGQFPALAAAIHSGHIAEGSIIAARRLTPDDMFSGTDPFRQDATTGTADAKTIVVDGGTPLEAFAVGRITASFHGGDPVQPAPDILPDPASRIARSVTGELEWDFGRGTIRVMSSRTQAVIGRTHGETVRLPAVTLAFETPWVSTIFTPLDDRPLVESRHILLTALARDKQTGTRYSDDGTVLESTGTPPLLLEPVQARITLQGPKPVSVLPCDPFGVPQTDRPVPVDPDGSFAIHGAYRAYYYEIKR